MSAVDDIAIFANDETDLQYNICEWINKLKEFNMKITHRRLR